MSPGTDNSLILEISPEYHQTSIARCAAIFICITEDGLSDCLIG